MSTHAGQTFLCVSANWKLSKLNRLAHMYKDVEYEFLHCFKSLMMHIISKLGGELKVHHLLAYSKAYYE